MPAILNKAFVSAFTVENIASSPHPTDLEWNRVPRNRKYAGTRGTKLPGLMHLTSTSQGARSPARAQDNTQINWIYWREQTSRWLEAKWRNPDLQSVIHSCSTSSLTHDGSSYHYISKSLLLRSSPPQRHECQALLCRGSSMQLSVISLFWCLN